MNTDSRSCFNHKITSHLVEKRDALERLLELLQYHKHDYKPDVGPVTTWYCMATQNKQQAYGYGFPLLSHTINVREESPTLTNSFSTFVGAIIAQVCFLTRSSNIGDRTLSDWTVNLCTEIVQLHTIIMACEPNLMPFVKNPEAQ